MKLTCQEETDAVTGHLVVIQGATHRLWVASHVASDARLLGGLVWNKASLRNRWELIRFSLLMVWPASGPLCICACTDPVLICVCVCECECVVSVQQNMLHSTVHEGPPVDIRLSTLEEWRTGQVLFWNADLTLVCICLQDQPEGSERGFESGSRFRG